MPGSALWAEVAREDELAFWEKAPPAIEKRLPVAWNLLRKYAVLEDGVAGAKQAGLGAGCEVEGLRLY